MTIAEGTGTILSVRISSEEANWLREQSTKTGISTSWHVRNFLRDLMKKNELTSTPKRITSKTKGSGNGSRRKKKRG
jgi:hypothetical protein